MISSAAHLVKDALADTPEAQPTRNGYGTGLVKLGKKNPHVVALCADLLESTRTEAFAKQFPARFVEIGVAEQNLVTVAAGLGISGKIPFVASYATFSPGRNWEQIRTTVAYNNANVKIAGHHTGVSVGPDGATHQALEDIAIMRALPNMRVIVPCDAVEAEKATVAAAHIWGPVYLRFGREKTPVMTTADTPFVPGRAYVMWQSAKPRAVIIGCGALLHAALRAAQQLDEKGIGTVVVNSHTVKPLDAHLLVPLAKKYGAVVTVEEHQIAGGLGSAVAELLAREAPVPIEYIGMHDSFGESGTPEELIVKYGMGVADIAAAVRRAVKRAR